MVAPRAEGAFEAWPTLAPTLTPLLKEEVGALFLPWSAANAAAIVAGDKTFEMSLGGTAWSQESQKYQVRSLAEIRRKYVAAKAAPGLEAILRESGCLDVLAQA
jgi:hypothetical protein